MALLTRKALIGVKFEATAGTAETLAAADADIHLSDPGNLTPDFTEHEVRPYGGTLSRNVSVIGLQSGTATFTAYGKGSGTADTAPAWGKAVIPCGMTETVNSGTSVVYAFNSTSDVAARFRVHLNAAPLKLYLYATPRAPPLAAVLLGRQSRCLPFRDPASQVPHASYILAETDTRRPRNSPVRQAAWLTILRPIECLLER